MKNQLRFLILLLVGIILIAPPEYSQSFLRINDEIRGSGSGNSDQTNNADNTAIYVVGGLAVVGIIAYVVISKSNKKNEEEKPDTSSALQQFNGLNLASGFDDFEHEYKKMQEKIPVNLILGVRNDKAFVTDKTYLLGLSVRF